MIFDEILIKNFGVYRDTQCVSLAPPSPEKPVILFGGLNGVGKTTLLDALQLVLYGKSARCSNRGSLPYDEYLRRSIHRTADPKDGASLEVQFYHTSDGRKHTYRINRSWSFNGNGVRENVEVARDGVLDRVLTESWTEYVESFIPLRISNLFFFDGEKIEGLADLENSTEVLSTAIRSLLGLDIVDRLLTDLVVLERRKRETLKNDIERQRINELKEEIQRLEQRREDLVIERGAAQNDVDHKTKLLNEVEDEFRLQGGELFERQKMLEAERATVVNHLKESEEELRDIASGPTPMILIGSLLNEVDHQSDSEEEAAQAEILGSILAERDNQILKEARKHKAHKQVLDSIKEFLVNDRNQRIKASSSSR
jgi:DNA sulfur modification protein DndD